jgi:hypothetical protein
MIQTSQLTEYKKLGDTVVDVRITGKSVLKGVQCEGVDWLHQNSRYGPGLGW